MGEGYIFIHVPKTGGTSIRQALKGSRQRPLSVRGAAAAHARASDYIAGMGRERWNEAFRFAVVRDPFTRLVSCWAFAFGMGAPSVERFCEWVDSGMPLKDRYRFKVRSGHLVWMHAPQVEWLTDEGGSLAVHDLLRLERLERDWPRVAGRLGCASSITHENRSDHLDVALHYQDKGIREAVEMHYAQDFALLDSLA